MFTVGQVIKVNKQAFTITEVEDISDVLPGHYQLTGTKQGDPSFLAGKRTIFTNNLTPVRGGYSYDWNAK